MDGRIIRVHLVTATRRHLLGAMLGIGVAAATLLAPFPTAAETRDSDGDGIQEEIEVAFGTLWYHGDTDIDGLLDSQELFGFGTNPLDADSDDDGYSDFEEVSYTFTSPLHADTDGDGRTDKQEAADGTDPRLVDAVSPPADLPAPDQPAPSERPDRDGDGLADDDEVTLYGTHPDSYDTDADYLSDGQEVLVQATDPLNPDTDGDGRSDGEEVQAGTDPLRIV